ARHPLPIKSPRWTWSPNDSSSLSMPPTSLLLQATGLTKSYTVPVLSEFSFELMRGEVHALVGSNGAGKSTFARILSGLTQPEGGQMELEGVRYVPRSKREAEHAGVIM